MISRLMVATVDYGHGLLLAASQGRSPRWPTIRRQFLKMHPNCAACGRSDFLAVHHKIPFHIDPSRECDFDNLMTLCEGDPDGRDDHLHVGHNGNWHTFNPHVENDAAELLRQRI